MALSLRERHGYEIIQQVKEDSLGRMKIGPGALYTSIRHLHERGLIAEVRTKPGKNRRYYAITPLGQSLLAEELDYYTEMLSLAKKRRLLEEK